MAIGHHHVDEQAQGAGQQRRERFLVADRGVARQRRQDDDAERHADDPERDLQQREREVEVRHRAVAEQAGERRDDDEGDLGHPEPDRPRRHQQQCLARLRVVALDPGVVAEAHPRQRTQLDEQVAHRTGDDAQGQTLDPEARAEDQRAADDREVVDDRRDGRRGEPTAGVEDARRHGAHRQEDRAEQHDPRQLDGPVELRALEAGGDDRHDDRRQDEQDDRQDDQADEHQVDDGRDDPPGARMLVRDEQADTIGISADDRAPAATSWKIRSGIRNAAKNASSSVDGKALAMTMTRT